MTLKHLTNAAALVGMMALGTAHADEAVSARRITHIGCHYVNGV